MGPVSLRHQTAPAAASRAKANHRGSAAARSDAFLFTMLPHFFCANALRHRATARSLIPDSGPSADARRLPQPMASGAWSGWEEKTVTGPARSAGRCCGVCRVPPGAPHLALPESAPGPGAGASCARRWRSREEDADPPPSPVEWRVSAAALATEGGLVLIGSSRNSRRGADAVMAVPAAAPERQFPRALAVQPAR